MRQCYSPTDHHHTVLDVTGVKRIFTSYLTTRRFTDTRWYSSKVVRFCHAESPGMVVIHVFPVSNEFF